MPQELAARQDTTPLPHAGPTNFAARVTAQIRVALANGVRPWVQPWSNAAACGLPLNASGAPYRGINTVILWTAAQARSFQARHWFTFKRAAALGAHVRRGERATQILYYSSDTLTARRPPGADTNPDTSAAPAVPAHDTTTDTARPRRFLKTYHVFNADQIDDLPPAFRHTPPPATPDDTILLARLDHVPAFIQHGGARAFYNLATDTIHLPPRDAFLSTAHYAATRLHELAHWTGHATRLDRQLRDIRDPTHGPTHYAREELVAELTAAFLGAELGLPIHHIEDHAAYLDAWLQLLDHDPGALLTAAGKAQAAADYLRRFLAPPDAFAATDTTG